MISNYAYLELRHKAGLHHVTADVINEMYQQTFPLLNAHFSIIDQITLLRVPSIGIPERCLHFAKKILTMKVNDDLPLWAKTNVVDFLDEQIRLSNAHLQQHRQVPIKRIKGKGSEL